MAAKTSSQLDLQRTDGLLKLLLILSRTVTHVLDSRAESVAGESLSSTRIQILRLLGQRGSQTATQIARYMGVSKPAVTQVIDTMVRGRLVTRKRMKEDRRGIELNLTPKGRTLFQRIRNDQRHLLRNAVRSLPKAAIDRWNAVLEEVIGALAHSEKDFEQYCLQCGSHSDGKCVLVGGKTTCLFLDGEDNSKATGQTAKKRARRSKRTKKTVALK